jgi:hypothetical protein
MKWKNELLKWDTKFKKLSKLRFVGLKDYKINKEKDNFKNLNSDKK